MAEILKFTENPFPRDKLETLHNYSSIKRTTVDEPKMKTELNAKSGRAIRKFTNDRASERVSGPGVGGHVGMGNERMARDTIEYALASVASYGPHRNDVKQRILRG